MPDQTPRAADTVKQLRRAEFLLLAPTPLDIHPTIRLPLGLLLHHEASRQELFTEKGMRPPDCALLLDVARAVIGSAP